MVKSVEKETQQKGSLLFKTSDNVYFSFMNAPVLKYCPQTIIE